MKILCLGSSFTNNVTKQPADQPWPYHVFKALSPRYPGLQVLNAGVSGASIQSLPERYTYLRDRADLVIVELTDAKRMILGLSPTEDRSGLAHLDIDHIEEVEPGYQRAIRASPMERIGLTHLVSALFLKGQVTDYTRDKWNEKFARLTLSRQSVEGFLDMFAKVHSKSAANRVANYAAVLLLDSLIRQDGKKAVFFEGRTLSDGQPHPFLDMIEERGIIAGHARRLLLERMGKEAYKAAHVDDLHLDGRTHSFLSNNYIIPWIEAKLNGL